MKFSESEKQRMRDLKSVLSQLRSSGFIRGAHSDNEVQKILTRLQKIESFSEEMFTGITIVPPELPRNIRDLLNWEPMYIQITNQFQKVTRSASRILANVKIKGEARGDRMEAEVEDLLFKQISEGVLFSAPVMGP